MDKKIQLDKLDLFPSKSEIPLRMSSFKCHTPKNNFLSKSHFKPYISNKYYFNGNKRFLKNKRKDKNSIRCEMPDTPHNTGQYLCHIYQENQSKENKKQKYNDENDDLGMNFFEEDDNDDFGDDYLDNLGIKFDEDPKRERLMSLEGKDLENFLFTPGNKINDKKIFKSAILFDNPENHINLDSDNFDHLPMMKDK